MTFGFPFGTAGISFFFQYGFRFTVNDLREQTKGVECRKDGGVLDEIPGAYKDIAKVMEQQRDLVEIVAELRQVLCVKG